MSKKYKTKEQLEFEKTHNKMMDEAYKDKDKPHPKKFEDMGIDYFGNMKKNIENDEK